MLGASGASVAGPLFHELMNEATQWVHANYSNANNGNAPLVGLRPTPVCELSGQLPNAACPSHLLEWFVPGTEPRQMDTIHALVELKEGALATGCSGAKAQVIEQYPPAYAKWAKEAGRPIAPSETWLNCETKVTLPATPSVPTVEFPRASAVYRLITDEPSSRQQLVFRASASSTSLTFIVDGKPYRSVSAPFEAEWPLARGRHQVQVITPDGQGSAVVPFSVE
jgi:membrane carboxypeptidase/penicillin-binding protein PbpC